MKFRKTRLVIDIVTDERLTPDALAALKGAFPDCHGLRIHVKSQKKISARRLGRFVGELAAVSARLGRRPVTTATPGTPPLPKTPSVPRNTRKPDTLPQ